jgi:putative FmdB family regulatory protein
MPTYRYQCDACGHELELFQSMTESPKRKCPDCGRSKLQRLIGAGAGVIFKGSGFYETDYRSASYKAAEKASGEGSAAAADSKPADGKPADGKAGSSKPAAGEAGPAGAKPSRAAKKRD